MLGAILGDIAGSRFEFHPNKSKNFKLIASKCHYTDDTVMTIAVADATLTLLEDFEKNHLSRLIACLWNNTDKITYKQLLVDKMKYYGRAYMDKVGYGPRFKSWLLSDDRFPYGSWGNGSAMRVSSIGWLFYNKDVLNIAKYTADVTHNTDEGIKGAQAIAIAIFLARTKNTKEFIKNYIEFNFGYNLSRTLDEIRDTYKFEVSCQKSVPEAIIAFLESTSIEDAIKNAISLGGDADTQACMAGAIAEAYYNDEIECYRNQILSKLPNEFCKVIERFDAFRNRWR